jgi:hypothetical protein
LGSELILLVHSRPWAVRHITCVEQMLRRLLKPFQIKRVSTFEMRSLKTNKKNLLPFYCLSFFGREINSNLMFYLQILQLYILLLGQWFVQLYFIFNFAVPEASFFSLYNGKFSTVDFIPRYFWAVSAL